MGTQVTITVDDLYLEQVDTFRTMEEQVQYIAEVLSTKSIAEMLLRNRNRTEYDQSGITIVGMPEALTKKSYNKQWAYALTRK
jgi:hypothetical protein